MTSFQINDNELTAVKGKVAVITGISISAQFGS